MNQNTEYTDYGESGAHDVLGRLFTAAEPPHREMAEAAIAQGGAALRRQRMAVTGGAVLSVAAVAAAVLTFGGHSTAPGQAVSTGSGGGTLAYGDDDQPTVADKQREANAGLPDALNALLHKDGLTVAPDKYQALGPVHLVLKSETDPSAPAQSVGWSVGKDAFADLPKADNPQRITVPGGHVIAVDGAVPWLTDAPNGTRGKQYTFVPDAHPAALVQVYQSYRGQPLLSVETFAAMVTDPGFATVHDLLDPDVPATSQWVARRETVNGQILQASAATLPAGFRLRLSPVTAGQLELVGPQGVSTFDWEVSHEHQADFSKESMCRVLPADQDCSVSDVPGGKLFYQTGGVGVVGTGAVRLGAYDFQSTDPAGIRMLLKIFREPGSAATPGPGLTVDQVVKIAGTPDLIMVFNDLSQLTRV